MIIAFGPGGQERNVDGMTAAARQQAARRDDENRIGGARQSAGGGSLEIQRPDGRGAGAQRHVRRGDLDVLRRGPCADGGIDGVVAGSQSGVTEATARGGGILQELRVGVSPAPDERDVGSERTIEDLVGGGSTHGRSGAALTADQERRGVVGARQGGEAQDARRGRIHVTHVHHRLSAGDGQGAQQLSPCGGVGAVEGGAFQPHAAGTGDDGRSVADSVLHRRRSGAGDELQIGITQAERTDVGERGRTRDGIAGISTDLTKHGRYRSRIRRCQPLKSKTVGAEVSDRRRADQRRSGAETDEARAADGKCRVKIPQSVEIEGASEVILDSCRAD